MSKHNVFFIVIDTLRKDVLFENLDRLPNIKGIMDSSILFPNAVSPSSWTIPTHASMFTGLYPSEHGMIKKYGIQDFLKAISAFPRKRITVQEEYRKAGYETVSVTANRVIGEDTAFDRIYDQNISVGPFKENGRMLDEIKRLTKHRHMEDTTTLTKGMISFETLRKAGPVGALKIADLVLMNKIHHIRAKFPFKKGAEDVISKYIDLGLKGNQFVYLNFMEQHEPYRSCKDFQSLIATYLQCHVSGDCGATKAYGDTIANIRQELVESLQIVDQQIGRLIHHLHNLGIYQDSTIVLTSDHGQSLGEDNFVGHEYLLSDPLVMTPVIIKQAQAEHKSYSDYVSTNDIYWYLKNCLDGKDCSYPVHDFIFAEAFGLNELPWKSRLGKLSEEHKPEIWKRVWYRDGSNMLVNGTKGIIESVQLKENSELGSDRKVVAEKLLEELDLFTQGPENSQFKIPEMPQDLK